MATGPVGWRKTLFVSPTVPGTPVAPIILTGVSAAAGPVTSFDLNENQKRWVVIGICLNRLLLPVLRDFVGQEVAKHYTSLKSAHGIDIQVFRYHLTNDVPFQLNYGSINNNWGSFKKRMHLYDYKVNTAEDLAKLYLEPHMAKFTGFDNTCDLSAVLGILANASVFHTRVRANAKDLRSKVRNKWGHCNFDHWTDLEFKNSFQLMETMIRSLRLPIPEEDKGLDELHDWERKGLKLCMGCPVDKDLMKLFSVEVANLGKEVENIRQSSTGEVNKISAALQITRDEIDNFEKRINDIEIKLEAEQKEQLEKQEALSGIIGDISNELAKIDERVDLNKEETCQLKERQSNLETTVSSVKVEQASLNSEVGALKIGQTQLDSRVKALEESSFDATANVKIFQVPSRNHYFCGRDSELEDISAQLKNTQRGCAHSVICGLGGVGKTSLAVEFLWRHEGDYPGGIFWISGENNNLFQRSLSEMARQIGAFDNDFYNSLSRTLDWLAKREELWCLVVDNLDELEMSIEMRKLLTGHWKHAASGHIIITTRREVTEVEEETGVDEQCCIELKCLTEEKSIQFLRMRTSNDEGENSDMRELVRELGGLPLALDQAGAYMRCLKQSTKEYVKKYRKQKLRLLKKKKAQNFVENTSPERLAVHTTWMLNFDHINRISEEMELGGAPTLFMQLCAFLGPDDIPYELINEGLNKENSSTVDSGLWDQAEILSLLTKFSLFQRYGTNSFSVHRLVQEVIRGQLENEQTELKVLFCAVGVLHHALKKTLSPAEVCQRFVEDSVFSAENFPSLHLWGKLALHATFLQEHLQSFSAKHKESVHTLLYTEEVVRIFNEAGIFFDVSQEKVKAQEIQELKLDFLVNLKKSSKEDETKLPNYFIYTPLKDRHYKLISHCMRQPAPEDDSVEEADTSRMKREGKANHLREQGNLAVKTEKFEEATELYSSAISFSASDYRLFANRALCYLKLGQPQQALDDCENCLSLKPYYSKALQRKAWALKELVKSGASHLVGEKTAALAVAVHFDPDLRRDKKFNELFPEIGTHSTKEIRNAQQLAVALSTGPRNETLLLHEGEYQLANFFALKDLQIVGLGRDVILTCKYTFYVHCARCYFDKIIFPKHSTTLVCQGKDTAIHLKHCKISGGSSSCEDLPDCNGGPGCIAASRGKPVCDRTGQFGNTESPSGFIGFPGVRISHGSSALIEDCVIYECGGGGALVGSEGSRLEVRKCEVYRNHQAGLEAREGGNLVAIKNRVFSNGDHGILIGPNAGECNIRDNKIFENAKEGVFAGRNTTNTVICNNDVHHNRGFGLSFDQNSCLLIRNNRIFENGFWGIQAKLRTSAKITENVISGNKCGGIFIGVNYSGRVHLESNIVRDHSGPWLEYLKMPRRYTIDVKFNESDFPDLPDLQILQHPDGETQFYSNPPILDRNKEFNNEEGMHHPGDVIERFYSGCTFCRCPRDEVRHLRKCPTCHIASYCSKECQHKHWSTHKTLCSALKSRYSVTVIMVQLGGPGFLSQRIFGTHLKGIGTGPKPKRNSRLEFIVKIQTQALNCHQLQMLCVYDKSLTIDCYIQSPEIFSVIMECGVLGRLNKFASKKAFFWAMFAEKGEKLTIFLDHLAPYQEW